MKKSKIFSLVILLTVVSLLVVGCGSKKDGISEDDAKRIAAEHFGYEVEDVDFVKVKKDSDDGVGMYEIDFNREDKKYDVNVDLVTGEVLSAEEEYKDSVSSGSGTEEELIGEDKAKEIALTKVEGAGLDDIKEFKKDSDDGKTVYEGKIIYEGIEYEFDIDAVTGDILKWEEEVK